MAYNPPTYGESGEVYTDNVRNSLEHVRTAAEAAQATADGNTASVAAASQTADEAREIAEAAKAFVQAPTDGRVSQLVEDTTSETATSLNAAFVDRGEGVTRGGGNTTEAQSLPFLNARDYGAVGDGVTDDTAAIQAALTDLTGLAPHRGLHLPGGTYVVSAPLRVPGGALITGAAGSVHSTLRAAGGATFEAILVSRGWWDNYSNVDTGIHLRHLTIDGNAANGAACNGVTLYSWRSSIADCTIRDTSGYGVRLAHTNQEGSTATGTAVENRIERCLFENCEDAAIFSTQSNGKYTDGFLTDCVIDHCGDTALYGVFLGAAGGWLVRGNHFYTQAARALQLFAPDYTRITDNYFEPNGLGNTASTTHASLTASGFTSTSTLIVSGNAFHFGGSDAGVTYYGAFFSASAGISPHITVVGNTFSGVDGEDYAIRADVSSIVPMETGNRFHNCPAPPVSLGSGRAQVSRTQWVGSGSPEGVVTAPPGSTFARTDGGAGTSYYVKESGTGNTGWVAK